MADEIINIAVDSKTVTTALTPEALTTRKISCASVFIIPLATNTNPVFVTDSGDTTKLVTIPSGGLTVPIGRPELITIDVTTNGEGVEWMAV